jgi:hypothetical protein
MRRLRARALALCCLAPSVAAAIEPEPQQHEVRLDIDLQSERGASGAFVDAQYTWTPGALNRVDEVVPILRRFIRHKTALWVGIGRNGNTREQVTGARAGGIVQVLDGRLYTSGEVGIEYDVLSYDRNEHAYWAAPVMVEVGARPLHLLSIGGFYAARPVVAASPSESVQTQAERSGREHRFGATLTGATPSDRIFATLSGWLVRSDWEFTGFHPGDLTVRGVGASLRIAFQLSSSFTLQLRGQLRRENWVNARAGDEMVNFVGVDLDRDVLFAHGDAEVIYWHRGRHGFRFGLGGGYDGRPPLVNSRETALFRIGLGLITRF